MNNIFITSDLHLGHANIIGYCNRPFYNVEEMDKKIINNWNSIIDKGDTVYFLGDFCMGGVDIIKNYVQQLNGKITMIRGNHDHKKPRFYVESGFYECIEHPILVDGRYILSHHPIFTNISSPYINIYGHVHNDPTYKTITPFNACVCLERWDYKPILFNDLKKKILELRCEDWDME